MGNFFTSSQIYNNNNLSRSEFIDTFCKAMKTEGYVTCDGDEAEKSYILKFADNCKWVTITSEEYGEGNQTALSDTSRIAKMLKTSCVNTTVIDSDCAVMEIYSKSGKKADTLIMGRADDYFGDDISLPSEKVWKPFLADESSWEQLCNILNNSENYTFVEDALSELAPLIGMDDSNILFSAEDADEDEQTVFLGFKKAEAKEKKLTFVSAFKLVFGEMLEPMGYKYLKKGKYPYFVKVINNEILHIISYRHVSSSIVGHKAMEIHGGAISLYRREIDLTDEPTYFLPQIHRYYNGPWGKLAIDLMGYECNMSDNESLTKDMKRAAELVKEYILSVIADVTNLESYVKYAKSFHCIDTDLCELDEYENNQSTYRNESYLLIITRDDDDGIKRMEDYINSQLNTPVIRNNPEKLKECEAEIREQENNDRLEYIALRDRLINDKELFKRVEEIVQKNRANNLEMLEELGLISKKAEAKEKKLTLNAAFKQVFGKALEPLGFIYAKTKKPCYLRLVDNDMVHIIALSDNTSSLHIQSGIFTLYRNQLDLNDHKMNTRWLRFTGSFYRAAHPHDLGLYYPNCQNIFQLYNRTPESMYSALKASLEEVKKWVITVMDNVKTLEDFIYYQNIVDIPQEYFAVCDRIRLSSLLPFSDGAAVFALDDPFFVPKCCRDYSLSYGDYELEMKEITEEEYQESLKIVNDNYNKECELISYVLNNPEFVEKTKQELERRKAENLEILKGYGLNV